MKLHIVFEDDEVIVCYKPAGIPTQTDKIGAQDMDSLLKNYLKGGYVAVIHRLDQPVEGLLVFAKTPFAARELNKGLRQEGFGKYYKAVVCGTPAKKQAELENYLIRDGRTNISRVCQKEEKDAKKALLHYEVLVTSIDGQNEISLVRIKLGTGRHHQIRVQMANIGCPIWGDSKYNETFRQNNIYRQIALCAYRLEFVHPKTKKIMEFEVEPQGEGFAFFSLDKPSVFQ